MEAAGIELAKDFPGQCVRPVGVALPREGCLDGVSGDNSGKSRTTWKATSTQMEGAPAPKVCAGKVITDRRKTRATSRPERRPRSVGGAVKRDVGCLKLRALLKNLGKSKSRTVALPGGGETYG